MQILLSIILVPVVIGSFVGIMQVLSSALNINSGLDAFFVQSWSALSVFGGFINMQAFAGFITFVGSWLILLVAYKISMFIIHSLLGSGTSIDFSKK